MTAGTNRASQAACSVSAPIIMFSTFIGFGALSISLLAGRWWFSGEFFADLWMVRSEATGTSCGVAVAMR